MTMPTFGSNATAYLPPDPDPQAVIAVLSGKLRLQTPEMLNLDAYYRGKQQLSFLSPEITQIVGDRLKSLVINWPRVSVETLEERLNLTGFRFSGETKPDNDLWRIWQANEMEGHASTTHLSYLRHGRAFVSVWGNPADKTTPIIAFESPRQMAVSFEPGSRKIRAALKLWSDGPQKYATVYLPNQIVKFEYVASQLGPSFWKQYEVVENPLGRVPIVAFLNRWDIDRPDGESEMTDIIPLADAVNKLATDMMVTSEFHAEPRRWATGLEIGDESDADKLRDKAERYWDNVRKGKSILGGKGVAFGQFAAADLRNFTDAQTALELKLAAMGALPPHYVGITTANPASADAIRSSESALDQRCSRKIVKLDEPWGDVQSLVVQVRDGKRDERRVESMWAATGTPTVAQTADAAVKLHGAGIIDAEHGQVMIGLSKDERDAITARRDALTGVPADMQKLYDMALHLIEEYGVPARDAFASVGLIIAPKGTGPGASTPVPPADDPAVTPAAKPAKPAA